MPYAVRGLVWAARGFKVPAFSVGTSMAYDILIRGGMLLDGSGKPGVPGDLAIEGGRIVALGQNIGRTAKKTIDATGLAVAPGFIDIKTHSDFTLPINPKAESKVRQGVTTEIIGHCGFSVAPALPGKVALLKDYLSPSAPWLPFRELTFPDYLDTFPNTAVNAGMLVGHNTLRLMVMGMDQRAPTRAEMNRMVALLEEGLDAGAIGLSSGLFTAPGSYAAPDEMKGVWAGTITISDPFPMQCSVTLTHTAGKHYRELVQCGPYLTSQSGTYVFEHGQLVRTVEDWEPKEIYDPTTRTNQKTPKATGGSFLVTFTTPASMTWTDTSLGGVIQFRRQQ